MSKKPDKTKKKSDKNLFTNYFLRVLDEKSFEEVFSFRFTPLFLLSSVISLVLIIIVLTAVLIVFTPIREFIPGYPDKFMRVQLIGNLVHIDSLEHELAIRDQYINNFKDIMQEKTIEHFEPVEDSSINYDEIDLSAGNNDSIFRVSMSHQERSNVQSGKIMNNGFDLGLIHFFPPVTGLVTSSFDLNRNHFGTDIVAKSKAVVKAILDGTVISSTWSVEFGYVIEIQHNNNIISFYKHNSELLKRTGDKVKAGEAIAIIGNSGELTTGPHLHFELWYNGTPLNPEKYIVF